MCEEAPPLGSIGPGIWIRWVTLAEDGTHLEALDPSFTSDQGMARVRAARSIIRAWRSVSRFTTCLPLDDFVGWIGGASIASWRDVTGCKTGARCKPFWPPL